MFSTYNDINMCKSNFKHLSGWISKNAVSWWNPGNMELTYPTVWKREIIFPTTFGMRHVFIPKGSCDNLYLKELNLQLPRQASWSRWTHLIHSRQWCDRHCGHVVMDVPLSSDVSGTDNSSSKPLETMGKRCLHTIHMILRSSSITTSIMEFVNFPSKSRGPCGNKRRLIPLGQGSLFQNLILTSAVFRRIRSSTLFLVVS